MKMKRFLLLTFLLTLFISLTSCKDGEKIEAAKQRLQQIEREVMKAISEKNFEYAKVLCVQMKWEAVAKSGPGQSECRKLKQIWDEKSRSYLKSMGFNPDELLGKKREKSTLEQIMNGE